MLDGEAEAKLIAMRLGKPPAGYGRWTLRLLAERWWNLKIVESISHETVRTDAKKNGMTKRKIEYWVIPPEADAEFVACMEEVLETYAKPYDPKHPVLCMDEQPVQLLEETRVPIPATKEHAQACRLRIRTQRDGQHFHVCRTARRRFGRPPRGRGERRWTGPMEVAQLLDTRYADCETVTLVCDNLNTHTKGAFYEAFPAEKARELRPSAEHSSTRPSTAVG